MKKYKIVLFYIYFIVTFITITFTTGCATRNKNHNLNSTSIVKSLKLKKDSEFLYSEAQTNSKKIKEHLVLNSNDLQKDKKDSDSYIIPLIWLLVMLPIVTLIFSFLRNLNFI